MYIEQQHKFASKAWWDAWLARAKSYLDGHFDAIAEFIRQNGVASPSVGTDESNRGEIKQVYGIRPKEVTAVKYGHISGFGESPVEPGWDPVTITVAVELDAQVSRTNWRRYLSASSHVDFKDRLIRRTEPQGPATVESREAVIVSVDLKASLREKKNGFTDLSLVGVYNFQSPLI